MCSPCSYGMNLGPSSSRVEDAAAVAVAAVHVNPFHRIEKKRKDYQILRFFLSGLFDF